MKNHQRLRRITVSGVVAALYTAMTLMQEFILPGSTTMGLQVRLSEALTVLALFTPDAVWGLTAGCFISNLISLGAIPTDVLLGSLATFLSAAAMRALREVKLGDLPLVAFFMPVLFNGVIIGAEIEIFFIEGPFTFAGFLTQGGLVALGEAIALFTLGILLYKSLKNKKIVNT